MTLTLLHTAQIHCQTFDALRDQIAPEAELRHVVRPDWLARAQAGEDVSAELAAVLHTADGTVLCSCTTLGPDAARLGAIRIDQPMMAEAARLGGPIVMAYCLDSTYRPSLDLLEAELAGAKCQAVVHPLPMQALWPLFEAGMTTEFGIAIAGQVRHAKDSLGDLGCVVLAQASMAGAAALLVDLGVPVLSSPDMALRAALAQG